MNDNALDNVCMGKAVVSMHARLNLIVKGIVTTQRVVEETDQKVVL